MDVRRAGHDDLDGLTELLTDAFSADPVWRWAFPDPADLAVWWRFCIGSALRYPWVWIAGDYAAAAVWIPPGGRELTDEEEDTLQPLLRRLAGDRAGEIRELLERFDAAHPHDAEHFYLSLLGTSPRHRGRGIGMALLQENLRLIDAEGRPAYLESSNPRNDRRYEGVGFARVGSFTTPGGGHTLSTMWRAA